MKIELIVVPYDVESPTTSGARAPERLLELGFEAAITEAGHVVEDRRIIQPMTKGGKTDTVIHVARATARAVARASSRGRFPLVLAGGCLTAVGVAHGLQRMARDFGAVWVDAHGDFNTPETTPSGYWDGMALATLCGRSLPAVFKAVELAPVPFRRIAHLGGRALDPSESEDFARLHVLLLSPAEMREARREAELRERLRTSRELYLHIDLDGLDPEAAPAVALPVPDGIPLDAMLGCLGSLPAPIALTLSGMSFEGRSEAEGKRQLATCLALVERALAD